MYPSLFLEGEISSTYLSQQYQLHDSVENQDQLDGPMELSRQIKGDLGVALTRLRCGQMGHVFKELPTQDQGIDAIIEIAGEDGAHTGRLLGVQIKCGKSFFKRGTPDHFLYWFDKKHIKYWQNYDLPVIVIISDPWKERAYWGPVSGLDIQGEAAGVDVTIPRKNLFDKDARATIADIAVKQFTTDGKIVRSNLELAADGTQVRSIDFVLNDSELDDTSLEKLIWGIALREKATPQTDTKDSLTSPPQPVGALDIRVFTDLRDRIIGRIRARSFLEAPWEGARPVVLHNSELEFESQPEHEDHATAKILVFWTNNRDKIQKLFSDQVGFLNLHSLDLGWGPTISQIQEILGDAENIGLEKPSAGNFDQLVVKFVRTLSDCCDLQTGENNKLHELLSRAERLRTLADYELFGVS